MNASISRSPVGGSTPAIPYAVNIEVSFSLRSNARPAGRTAMGPTMTPTSSSAEAGSLTGTLEYIRRTSRLSSAART
jgi:hypothetical protein